MFAAYQAELYSVADAVETNLNSIEANDDVHERRAALAQIELDLGQADSLIRQMNVEARSDSNQGLKKELTLCKQRVKSLRHRVHALEQQRNRNDLFSRSSNRDSSRPILSTESREDRQRFELVTHRMDHSNSTLMDTRQLLAETEDVAIGITENLASNRSLIIGAHDRIQETGGMMGNARNILRRMQRQETRRKVILAGLILFLVTVIILIFYSVLSKGTKESTQPHTL